MVPLPRANVQEIFKKKVCVGVIMYKKTFRKIHPKRSKNRDLTSIGRDIKPR